MAWGKNCCGVALYFFSRPGLPLCAKAWKPFHPYLSYIYKISLYINTCNPFLIYKNKAQSVKAVHPVEQNTDVKLRCQIKMLDSFKIALKSVISVIALAENTLLPNITNYNVYKTQTQAGQSFIIVISHSNQSKTNLSCYRSS